MEVSLPYKVLSHTQIEQIRDAAFNHIERHGFIVQHELLLAKARALGAKVDETQGRVRMSRTLCTELIAQIPGRYTIENVLGESWEIGGGKQYGSAIVTDPWIIDYKTREPRRPCLEDVRRHTIGAEQLDPSIVSVSRMDYPVTDIPGPSSTLHALETHLLNHTRHYMIMPTDLQSLEQWLDIAAILSRGGDIKRLVTAAVAVLSPLVLTKMNCDMIIRAAENGFVIFPTICPMAGSTSPYSLAGTLLQSHIEELMVALMVQVFCPGHPSVYFAGPSVTDLRSGDDLYYTIDKVLWKSASVQLAMAEKMPVWAECGGALTHRYDLQSGSEGMLFMLAAHASGAHMISGFGSCLNALGMSGEMMVIQKAYLNAARHISRGIRTDDLNLAVESLQRVGSGGQFLEDDFTMKMMRSNEFFQNELFDLGGNCANSKSMLERAHERVEQMVTGYESRVPHDIQESLRRHFHDIYKTMQ